MCQSLCRFAVLFAVLLVRAFDSGGRWLAGLGWLA